MSQFKQRSTEPTIDIESQAIRLKESNRPDVKRSEITNNLVPTATANDLKLRSQLPFQGVTAGTTLTIYGHPVEVKTTGMEIKESERHGVERIITKFGFDEDMIGVNCQLYIDREPYLLNVASGPIWEIEPKHVEL